MYVCVGTCLTLWCGRVLGLSNVIRKCCGREQVCREMRFFGPLDEDADAEAKISIRSELVIQNLCMANLT